MQAYKYVCYWNGDPDDGYTDYRASDDAAIAALENELRESVAEVNAIAVWTLDECGQLKTCIGMLER